MTFAGLESVKDHLAIDPEPENHDALFGEFIIPEDIARALKKNKLVWKNFNQFSEQYKRVRIGWIDAARKRPEEFNKRLNYFIKMTAKNKIYGMIR
jgi:uncharacterized protein YdeI (YjbR/CyaY-like superfamily)